MSEQREEVADRRVQQALARLADRLEALEGRITGTVDCVTGAVRETTESSARPCCASPMMSASSISIPSRSKAHDRYSATRGDYPCQSMGLAAFAGFLAGSLGHRIPQMKNLVANYGELRASNGFLGQLADMAKAELLKVGETAIRTASAALRDNVQSLADDFRPGSDSRPHHNGVHADAV